MSFHEGQIPLITETIKKQSEEILGHYYENKLIPAEKKAYLSDLRHSRGPYLGVRAKGDETQFILDAASQIATIGLGFNPPSFFGVASHSDVWTNNTKSEVAKKATAALSSFFKRKTNWSELHLGFTHSGAEANELALGEAFQRRAYPDAKKVLAFEGSFHGRMMVTLSSTWNKSKREPFEWPGFETVYNTFAEDKKAEIFAAAPKDWKSTWANASKISEPSELKAHWKAEIASQPLIGEEVQVLCEVAQKLASREIFAVIAEPMQCEGGDRFATARFFNALALICRRFQVCLIFDEVQTGFHLGRDFFWHSTFNLKDENELAIQPDFVTCAKKAQMGMVISPKPISLYENPVNQQEYQLAGLIRGLTHAVLLDQSSERITTLEEHARKELQKVVAKFSEYVENPRAFGLSFAVDVKDKTLVSKLIEKRFDVGLLYYPAGDNTLRFRLNTAFKTDDLKNLFNNLEIIFSHIFKGAPIANVSSFNTTARDASLHYELSELFLSSKMKGISEAELTQKISSLISKNGGYQLFEIDSSNYQTYRDSIIQIESDVYEPARQTDIVHFDHAMKNRNGLAFGLSKEGKLVAIIFAAPLSEYPLERGLRVDPYFTDPDTLYMLDCTVKPEHQGHSLGLILKVHLSSVAALRGRNRLQGRNRDRLAASMLAINLELGAIEQNFIKEDYPDFETHRDVLYYSIDLSWPTSPELDLSSGQTRPSAAHPTELSRLKELLPVAVNKICLSNFVSESFLSNVKVLASSIKPTLRHLYTTSGQSEACDKVAKSLWFNRNKEKFNEAPNFLTFKNHYFGAGSFLARSLSGVGDTFFNVDRVTSISELKSQISKKHYLALYLEPLAALTGEKFSLSELKEIIEACHRADVKVVFNETASFGFNASPDYFYLSSHPELDVDACMCYLGAQAGLAFTKEEIFISAPLMMISTWDGDELSFALAADAHKRLTKKKDQVRQISKKFEEKLSQTLAGSDAQMKLENGFGKISGTLPLSLQRRLKKSPYGPHWIVAPGIEMMEEFIRS